MTRERAHRSPPIQERAFHRWLESHLAAGRSGLLPLGDDAAAIRPPRGQVAVLTTDALVEGTHFRAESDPGQVGAAAVGVSLSDLAAKGARPAAVLLAVVVPRGTPASWAQALIAGGSRCARAYGAEIVGGDTKPGPVRTIVSSAVGWAAPGRLAPRTAARPGDVLVTTGEVGRGGLAAAHLNDRHWPRARSLRELLDVRPRVREGIRIARWAHAMLDTSDGLGESAWLLSAASHVRVVVEESQLPLARGLARAARTPARRRTLAFFGGDYELLAAVPEPGLERAQEAVASAGGTLTVIGRVERGRGAWLATSRGRRPMPHSGWQPFGPEPVPAF